MIHRRVASLLLDVGGVNDADPLAREIPFLDQRAVVRPKANIDYRPPGLLYARVLLAVHRGVESLLGHDGKLGEPRTALGVVSGRHSRMLQR